MCIIIYMQYVENVKMLRRGKKDLKKREWKKK